MSANLPQTMTVVEITADGGPEVLKTAIRPLPEPKGGEVLIKVAAAGVNGPDLMQRRGLYPPPKGASDLLGLEVAGTVAALGEGADGWAVGEAVSALTNGGGYAEYCVVKATHCLPVPEGLGMTEAASLPETFFAVWSNVFAGVGLKKGENFLVHGGAGGIGTTAIQLAKAFGARVFATDSPDARCAACAELGADRVINYETEDFVEVVKGETPRGGADVILDTVGGDYMQRNIKALALDGRIIHLAFNKGPKAELNMMPVMLKRLTLTGSTLRSRPDAFKSEIARQLREKVWPLIANRRIKPVVHATFPLAEAANAHRLMESSAHVGKIVLVMIDDQIDAWVALTNKLTGQEVRERETWNHDVTADSIRHFAYGTDDDNPLWTDPDYAAGTKHGALVAPPAYLVSVLYPMLHGAPIKAPLASLIGGLAYEWVRPVSVGDRLRAVSKQGKFFEKRNKEGRRLNFVISDVTYSDSDGQTVGKATGTMIMATQVGDAVMFERPIHRLGDDELAELEDAFQAEKRTGAGPLFFEDVDVGQSIPSITRGPLTIGDMVAWNAAIGPSYKAGRWGFLELAKAPHAVAHNTVLNFPVKYSQQHEDPNLAAGRGMPGPFDNGVMRFAWVAPLVTNWMGDDGFLRRLSVQIRRPGLYGDVVVYAAKVTAKDAQRGTVTLEITGTDHDGAIATKGTAEVDLPRR